METDYLKKGQIILRPLETEDIDLLYSWENNTSIWELSNTKAPFSKHILAHYIKESFRDIYATKQLRLIIQNINKKPVGAIDLFDIDPYHQRSGIGILINNSEDRGKGYATDALKAICSYSLNIIGLRQLYANISSDNEISIKLFSKIDFEITGHKKEWTRTPAGWKDEIIMQKMLH